MCRILLHFILLGVFSVPAAGQVMTGWLVGTITDQTGGVLANATVTLSSPLVMGQSMTQTTNDKGQFRFIDLAPGLYDLTVEAANFETHQEEGIRVGLGSTVDRRIALDLAGLEVPLRVTPVGDYLDTKRSGESTHYRSEYLRNVPVARFGPYDLARSAPGMTASRPTTGPTVIELSAFGSSTNENLYVLDGTDFTEPTYGGVNSVPNLEAIEEVEIIATGASAEYGNFQGAVINLVSRQGGNAFRSDAGFYAQPSSLATSASTIPCFCPAGETGYLRDDYYDATAHLGGPIVPDRAWFFSGFRYLLDSDSQPGGDPRFPRRLEAQVFFGKINWQSSENLRWLHSVHVDFFVNRPPPAFGRPFETGFAFDGHTVSATLADVTYIRSEDTLWDFRASLVSGATEEIPNSGSFTIPQRWDVGTDTLSGGGGTIASRDRRKLALKTKLSHFATEFLNADHDFKFGAQFQTGRDYETYAHPGGANYFDYFGEPLYAVFREPWSVGGESRNVGAFAEDVLRASDRLNVQIGLRYDHTRAISPAVPGSDERGRSTDVDVAGLGTLYTWNTLAPRLGFAFDLTGNASTILRGTWGRFYSSVLTVDLRRNHPGLTPAVFLGFDPDAGEYSIPHRVRDSAAVHFIDPDTRPASTDQFSAGFEHEITRTWTAGVSYVGKRGRDFLGWRDTGGVYGETEIEVEGETLRVFPLLNAPEDRRFLLTTRDEYFLQYDALVATLRKRLSRGWQALVSYSRADGNGFLLTSGRSAGGPQLSSTGGFLGVGQDPNDDTNAQGDLRNDRTHMFRVQTSAHVPGIDVAIGANLQHLTGFPYGANTLVRLPQGFRRIHIETPGTRRLESQTLLDVRVAKVFFIGDNGRLEVLADFLNLLNEGAPETLASENVNSPFFELGFRFVDPRRVMLGVKVIF